MRLENISWVKAEQYFKTNDTVMLPMGSIECHGRHLPLGTDFLIPQKLVTLIEQKSDVLIAPALPYGCCDTLADFPGTVSLGHDVLFDVLMKITTGLASHGARRIVVLNGHGGNIPVIDRAALELSRRGMLLARLDWWLMAGEMNPLWKGGHGGAEETAGVIAVDPELVDRCEISDMTLLDLDPSMPSTHFSTVRVDGLNIPINRPVISVTGNGWVGPDHPRLATRQMGEEMLEAVAGYIARFIETFGKIDMPEAPAR